MNYKVYFEGFAYVEADSEDEAKDLVDEDMEVYSECYYTSVEEVDEFEIELWIESMGIYIEGLKMPGKKEFSSVRIYGNGEVTVEFSDGEEVVASAVEISKHGRLLDEDKICELLNVLKNDEYNLTHKPKVTWSRVMDIFVDLLGIVDTEIPNYLKVDVWIYFVSYTSL